MYNESMIRHEREILCMERVWLACYVSEGSASVLRAISQMWKSNVQSRIDQLVSSNHGGASKVWQRLSDDAGGTQNEAKVIYNISQMRKAHGDYRESTKGQSNVFVSRPRSYVDWGSCARMTEIVNKQPSSSMAVVSFFDSPNCDDSLTYVRISLAIYKLTYSGRISILPRSYTS